MDSNMEHIDILKYPLMMLRNVGLYSKTSRKRVLSVASIYLVILTFIVSTILFQFINFKGDVFKFVSNFEGFCGYMQHVGKIVLFITQHKKLNTLLNYGKYCWKTNRCPEKVKAQLDYIAFIIVRLQATFFICVLGAVITVCVSPFLGRSLPLGMWIKEEYQLLHKLALVAQITIMPAMGIFLVGFDTTFMSFCARLVIQFRILGSCFEELDLTDRPSEMPSIIYRDKMKSCIRQHILLLKFTKTLQEMFSSIMIVEYLSIAPLICSEMYVAFESDNLGTTVRYVLFSSTLTMQLAFYCIPADYVTGEAMKIGDYLYFSPWFVNYKRSCQLPIPLIIQQSQQTITFRGAGLFEINARSLLNVLKISWSTCTVIRGLKQKN